LQIDDLFVEEEEDVINDKEKSFADTRMRIY